MKNIKTFEEFGQVNELSGGLAYRARAAAMAKEKGAGEIESELLYRKQSKFKNYIDPEFKKKINTLGFAISKNDDDHVTLTINVNTVGTLRISVSSTEYNMNLKPTQLGDALLAKVNRAVKFTQEYLKNATTAENEL